LLGSERVIEQTLQAFVLRLRATQFDRQTLAVGRRLTEQAFELVDALLQPGEVFARRRRGGDRLRVRGKCNDRRGKRDGRCHECLLDHAAPLGTRFGQNAALS